MFKPFGFQLGTGTAGPNFAPVASNVAISGVFEVGETLTASYDYFDANGHPESGSIWQWYSSDDDETWTPISGANALTYEVTGDEFFLYIRFGVTPSDGSLFGAEVFSASGFVNWFAGAAGFLGDPLVTGQSVGGAIAEITNQANASPDLTQSTVGSRPTMGRYPIDGIFNIYPSYSNDFSQAAWTKTGCAVSGAGILVEDGALSLHTYGRNVTAVSGSTYTLQAVISAQGRSYALMAMSSTPFPTTSIQIDLVNGLVSTGTGTPLDAYIEPLGAGLYEVGFSVAATGSGTGNTTLYASTDGLWANRVYTGNSAAAIQVHNAQFVLGPRKPMQVVGAGPYDITETGVASVEAPYYNGDDFLTYGVAEFSSTADWFADTGHSFSGAFVVRTLTKNITIGTAKAGATAGDRTWQIITNSTSGKASFRVRGTLTELATTADLTDGSFHSVIYSFDGTTVTAMVDGIYVGSGIGVGAVSEEAVNAITGARTESPPGQSLIGFQETLFDREGSLTQAQMSQIHEYMQRTWGAL